VDQNANRPEGGKWAKKSTSQAFAEAAQQYQDAGLVTDKKQGLKGLLESAGYYFGLNDKITVDPETGKKIVLKNARFAEHLRKAEQLAGKVLADPRVQRAGKHLKTAGKRAGAAVPVAGAIIGHSSAAHAAATGDVQGAALDEFGNVPVAGDLVDAGRAGYSVGEAINEFLPEDVKNAIGGTIHEIVSEGGWKEIVRHPFGIGM
jgi:hypothetical protein